MNLALSIVFSGTAYAMVLYVTAVGLSVTMGLLGIANLAHGAFAMVGGYVLIVLMSGQLGLPFAAAVPIGCAVVFVLSMVLERLLYIRVYKAGELNQVVLSIGLIFVATATAQLLFGALPVEVHVPPALRGQVALLDHSFPTYRVFLIVSGFIVFGLLWLAIERTLVGARIRAAVDNRAMAEAIGVNTRRLFTIVFAVGSALAALGGMLGADVMSIEPQYPLEHLVYFLIVVAVGGLGSVRGPFLAALLLGIGDSACQILVPQFGAFFIYVALFLLLLAKPSGLFGRA